MGTGAGADASIGGHEARLRQVTVDDAALLELWRSAEYSGEFNDFGVKGEPIIGHIQQNGLIDLRGGTLIVEFEADGKPIGTVGWREVRYGPNPESVAWNIGISLIPEARGRGLGTQAQRDLAARLFATSSVNRIEAMTDLDNHAEQRSLEKAGFVREGVLRGAQYRHGGWHDLVVYSLVRNTT